MQLLTSDRSARTIVADNIVETRTSTNNSDEEVVEEMKLYLRDVKSNLLAHYVREIILQRTYHFTNCLPRTVAFESFEDVNLIRKKATSTEKQAVLIHATCLFDVNECSLDWIPSEEQRKTYKTTLVTQTIKELDEILGTDSDH